MSYTIGQFAQLVSLSIDTLRFYEKEGLIIPKRDYKNHRVFNEQDVTWINFIKRLKQTGMRLTDIKEYAHLRYQGDETIAQRLQLLYQQTDYLNAQQAELTQHLNFLHTKIAIYQNMLHEQTIKK
ncbi:MerR family transcriptional regulator [uncultured Enterococcus sp.]|uniref:MerR family transcriptional regulator n=1 Tax=uncultured Enterococcus sp. TaxID=167972 RepID=UPI0025FE2BCF|nr:MerR family transcriptional regulator [uncultured Enterococcus sp.]